MSIKQLTRAQLSFQDHAFAYHIPQLESNQSPSDLVNQWIGLVKAYPCHQAELKDVKRDQSSFITFYYLYEGWGEYHSFQITTHLVYLTDTRQFVVQGWIEQDVHDLMEVIIRLYFIPDWVNALGLQSV